jgi:uncharacterized membrane protein
MTTPLGPSLRLNGYSYGFLIFFLLLYGLGSVLNHYFLRTEAYDLGIYTQATYDYFHLQRAEATIMGKDFGHLLGDHFELWPILVSPLVWLFGAYGLLYVQIIAIILGAVGCYRVVSAFHQSSRLGNWAIIHFCSCWGIYSALGFDFHNNVIAAMFVPWLLFYYFQHRWIASFLCLVGILIAKENMALWAMFICMGLWIQSWPNRPELRAASIGLLLSSLYFIVVMLFFIPNFGTEGREYRHFHYHVLGKSGGEALHFIFTKPFETIQLLFISHLPDPALKDIKMELHFTVLAAGGFILLFRPQYFIMLLPIYGQKLFQDDMVKWGINYHYSIEFAPILTIALFTWPQHQLPHWLAKTLQQFPKLTLSHQRLGHFDICLFHQHTLAMVFAIYSGYSTYQLLPERKSLWYSKEKTCVVCQEHFRPPVAVGPIHQILNEVPDNAVVCASSPLVPHLAYRDVIYIYPNVQEAQYIVFWDDIQQKYPMEEKQFHEQRKLLFEGNQWRIKASHHPVYVFEKR